MQGRLLVIFFIRRAKRVLYHTYPFDYWSVPLGMARRNKCYIPSIQMQSTIKYIIYTPQMEMGRHLYLNPNNTSLTPNKKLPQPKYHTAME